MGGAAGPSVALEYSHSVFHHVTVYASDRAASEHFYRTVLAALGLPITHSDEEFVEWDEFSVAQASGERPFTRRLHLGFVAGSRARVDEFWRAGTAAGFRDDGAPGPRPQYSDSYYGSFLLDPDGNSAEAAHHRWVRAEGVIDHVWIRVADLAQAKRFYQQVAPHARFRLIAEATDPDRARFSDGDGSFSVVADGAPAEQVHMAFPAATDGAVDGFFDAMVTAGHRPNGAPGERARYHPGYYAAFVLDPDGNNVELVNHGRDGDPADARRALCDRAGPLQ